jgi:hypothetical protein
MTMRTSVVVKVYVGFSYAISAEHPLTISGVHLPRHLSICKAKAHLYIKVVSAGNKS